MRIAIYTLGGLLVLLTVVMWFAFPPHIRAQFTPFEVVTIIGLGLMFYAAGYALARSRVVAREDGLTVVNGYKTRRFEWNEVLAVSLRSGSPWAMIDLSDGTSVAGHGHPGLRRTAGEPPGPPGPSTRRPPHPLAPGGCGRLRVSRSPYQGWRVTTGDRPRAGRGERYGRGQAGPLDGGDRR